MKLDKFIHDKKIHSFEIANLNMISNIHNRANYKHVNNPQSLSTP